jgi:hypothetical protein
MASAREESVRSLSVKELRAAIRTWSQSHRIVGYSTMRREPLIKAILTEIDQGDQHADTLADLVKRRAHVKASDAMGKKKPSAAAAPKPMTPKTKSILDKKIVKHRIPKAVRMEKAAAKKAAKKK